MAIGTASSIGLLGLQAFRIQMQAYISPGLPYFSIIGLPDASLSEARERVKSACMACGFRWPETRVTVNLSPASKPKHGSSHDLAIAASVLAAGRMIPHDCMEHALALGELNLDGTVLPINGILPMLLCARENGITRAFVPYANLDEAALVGDVEVTGVRHLGELIERMGGKPKYRLDADHLPRHLIEPELNPQVNPNAAADRSGLDMSQVIGQANAKWALEVAAAGNHHMVMVGPPGSGKTMLATRLPGIMPPLSEREQLEVASIRSLCGTLPLYGIRDVPPFEAPHHTATTASLIGGGSGVAQPGAITRAHRGVLFMDEAPEFQPRTLQSLREPLETGCVAVARIRGTAYYPARFLLVMAANPCPCGFSHTGNGSQCRCTERERSRYWNRLSGPILDRIDIQINVPPVSTLTADAGEARESSADIRRRVIQARAAARDRYAEQGWASNAEASGQWLRRNTSARATEKVNAALDRQTLSLRGADRALRLAWTIADLAGRTSPNERDVETGIQLRTHLA
ncbi:YifB family Mg chelatase-like AAA ATPase [Bifidobacterium avesanii]|uniref:YifB family Mg chelatase-like AAA ATPase n=1 Tax=Bifidobacterium avesanii TaxID=1798157 RepID=A0A7K3TH78_9BIFI|nr:YifB family Mg chelatase-like AAA ATPase [Bifidobacterium avesanii]KAB8292837.1 ATPase AAA [Bifidobacterium avesanii]NEG78441.1 YifB family Mg chelatase-like AAA ATPase [Bifidobacterium avesanii]